MDVDRALERLGPALRRELARRIRAQARAREVFFYRRAGRRHYIPIALRPCLMARQQRRFLQRLCLALEWASVEIFRSRWNDPALQALLPLSEGEERWLRDAYGERTRRPETLFSRMDVSGELFGPRWHRTMRVLECNLTSIGAAYYCWAAGRIAHQVVGPHVAGAAPEDDLLEMIVRRCIAHGAKIGRPRPTIAFVQDARTRRGTYEFPTMCRLLNARGYRTLTADPADLRVRRDRLLARDERVDIVYRDPTLAELTALEAAGDDLSGLRWAFRRNRVVSSLAGEVDHKALLELLPARVPSWVRPYLPWTRALRPGRATDPAGREVDLADYVVRRRRRLVLKPNREYGGHGVMIGARATPAAWAARVAAWTARPGTGVVQECSPLRRLRLPLMRGAAYVVGGVHATEYGVATLARFSREPVVNITRGGGIIAVLVKDERR
jgi:hypothetical protein